MIRFSITVYSPSGEILESESASGNTIPAARAAAEGLARSLSHEYQGASIDIRREFSVADTER